MPFPPKEIEILKTLRHPNICALWDVINAGKKVFLIQVCRIRYGLCCLFSLHVLTSSLCVGVCQRWGSVWVHHQEGWASGGGGGP